MDKNQIINMLNTDPTLTYDELRDRAESEGVSSEVLSEVWREIKDESDQHNKRIKEIANIIRSEGRESKSRDQWKVYLSEKGYSDDECDIGYVTGDIVINTGPFSQKKTVRLIVILVPIFFLLVYFLADFFRIFDLFNSELKVYYIFFSIVVFFLILAKYMSFIKKQFRNIRSNAMADDFNGRLLNNEEIEILTQKWISNGSKFFSKANGKLKNLTVVEYDNRITYFGFYNYVVHRVPSSKYGGGGPEYIGHFIVVTEFKSVLPQIQCYRPLSKATERCSSFFGPSIQMEGVDFNKSYYVWANNNSDAYYALNPRVMETLLKDDIQQNLSFIEIMGNEICFGFEKKEPGEVIDYEYLLDFSNYERLKRLILKYLDISADIIDVFSREIVDSGEGRSVAKIE